MENGYTNSLTIKIIIIVLITIIIIIIIVIIIIEFLSFSLVQTNTWSVNNPAFRDKI